MIFRKPLKLILATVVLTAALLTTAMATSVTANKTVNVRAKASTSSSVVATMKKNATRTVLSKSGKWVKVKVSGKTGYVHTNNLTTQITPEKTTTSTKCVLRSLPTKTSTAVKTVASGTSVTMTGTCGSWFKVTVGEQEGFIHNSKLTNTFYVSVCKTARSLLGKAYVYGATGPNSFDCSGFTQYVYKKCGKSIPRTSSSQYASANKVSKSNLRAGQLVFFSGSGGGSSVGHVGIYVGDNTIIHAANSSTGVITSSLNSSYYSSHYIGAGYY